MVKLCSPTRRTAAPSTRQQKCHDTKIMKYQHVTKKHQNRHPGILQKKLHFCTRTEFFKCTPPTRCEMPAVSKGQEGPVIVHQHQGGPVLARPAQFIFFVWPLKNARTQGPRGKRVLARCGAGQASNTAHRINGQSIAIGPYSLLTRQADFNNVEFLNQYGVPASTINKADFYFRESICRKCRGVREAPGAVLGLGALAAFLFGGMNHGKQANRPDSK